MPRDYNEECPCCTWKFHVAPELKKSFGTKVSCVKCGSVWYSREK